MRYLNLKKNSQFLFKRGKIRWGWASYFLNKIFFKIKKRSSSFVNNGNVEFLEIEFFQLNNLIQNQIPFSFYLIVDEKKSGENEDPDHSMKVKDFPSKAVQLLKRAEKINSEKLHQLSPSQPVVLICRDGRKSQKMALELSKRWTNVFYIKDGWLGSKTDDSSES